MSKKLTSVNVDSEIYKEAKKILLNLDWKFQDLVHKSLCAIVFNGNKYKEVLLSLSSGSEENKEN